MLQKPHKEIEKIIEDTLLVGWDNSYIHTRKTNFGEIKFIKLKSTSLMFVYGWCDDREYWLLSDN